ncbi:penicillin acylase family protein [Roseiterribacter gracilis]|uniref:Penicillin amidase n=1 Tax=Roseiterribacter gracilis TaxID=2812848 RepID=A0A8S8X655_9PROT|nr:penicillin amidase [Rhodospirillales bacterium TMPK1]
MRLRIAIFGATILGAASAMAASPQQRYEVPSLQAPATILVDHWGIAHIRAKSADDAFFVQGFNAARDRLWQIDLARRRGLGLLAEVFGPAYAEQDRAARLFLYRGDMTPEWAAYGDDSKRATESFVAGINAYVAATERDAKLLPVEFGMLNYKPSRWTAEDVMRIRSNALARNLDHEVARAKTACAGALEQDRLRTFLHPVKLDVPEGLDPCAIPANVLDTYKLGTQEVKFDAATKQLRAAALAPEEKSEGSNHFTVAGWRSTTGRAIFASDPHRAELLPSLRYIVHLTAPGLNVIGAGEPSLPGVSLGHNDDIAFGLTIFAMDQEDLYVYETDPADPTRYRYKGGWEAMRVERETIAQRGADAKQVELRFTRHGPVIFQDAKTNRAFAVRSVWQLPGTAAYAASLRYLRAKDWSEFRNALDYWGTPSLNQTYADRKGNIGWKPAGALPIRPNWTGLLPVPGDGRYEWDGLRPMQVMPSEYNPASGWLGNGNNYTLPPFYPNEQVKVGFEWAPPFRADRIAQVLNNTGKISIQTMQKLQNDQVSLIAQRTLKFLPASATSDAAKLLRGWNGELAYDSAPAALYGVWYFHHLRPALLAQLAPGKESLLKPGDPTSLVLALENGDVGAERDALLTRTLAAAYAETKQRLGPDAKKWRWGDLHQAVFEHPVDKKLSVGPLAIGGDNNTVNAASLRIDDFRLLSGPSFRMVLDVGNWDASWTVNTPGQSGDPRSKHYADLAPLWARGKYVPMLFSAKAIDKNVEQKIELVPVR